MEDPPMFEARRKKRRLDLRDMVTRVHLKVLDGFSPWMGSTYLIR